MKNVLFVFALLVVSVPQFLYANGISEEKLYGEWVMPEKDGSSLTLELSTDGEYGMATLMQPIKYVEGGIGAQYKLYMYVPVYWSLNGTQLDVQFVTHNFDTEIELVKYIGVTESQAENEYAYDFEQLEQALINDFENNMAMETNPRYVFKIVSVNSSAMVVNPRGSKMRKTFKRVR